MGDYRFLTAIMTEKCVMCNSEISVGKPFYIEIGQHKKYCRTCGRVIRVTGDETKATLCRFLGQTADNQFVD